MRPIVVIVLLIVSLASATAYGQSMRCGSALVEIGDTQYQILKKCGEPTYVHGIRWIYDRGASRFLKILVFGSNGKLQFIREEMPAT